MSKITENTSRGNFWQMRERQRAAKHTYNLFLMLWHQYLLPLQILQQEAETYETFWFLSSFWKCLQKTCALTKNLEDVPIKNFGRLVSRRAKQKYWGKNPTNQTKTSHNLPFLWHDPERYWSKWILLKRLVMKDQFHLRIFSFSGESSGEVLRDGGQVLFTVVEGGGALAPATSNGLCHVVFL